MMIGAKVEKGRAKCGKCGKSVVQMVLNFTIFVVKEEEIYEIFHIDWNVI